MFDWYKIFTLAEFQALGLVARSLILNLEGRGVTRLEVTVGNTVAVQYDGVLLPVEFLDQNPYEREGYAVYLDTAGDVWFGFEVEE